MLLATNNGNVGGAEDAGFQSAAEVEDSKTSDGGQMLHSVEKEAELSDGAFAFID